MTPQTPSQGVPGRRKFPGSASQVPRCAPDIPADPPGSIGACSPRGLGGAGATKLRESGSMWEQSGRNSRNAESSASIWARPWQSREPGLDVRGCSSVGAPPIWNSLLGAGFLWKSRQIVHSRGKKGRYASSGITKSDVSCLVSCSRE